MVAVIPLTLVAAAATGGTNLVLALIPVLLGGGLLGAVVTYRAQNRKTDADARLASASADHTLQGTYQEWIEDQRKVNDDLRGRLDEMTAQMGDLRDRARAAEAAAADAKLEAARARTGKAEADQRVAELEAELAKALKQAGDDRHRMQSEILALEAKVRAREMEIADLRADFETLSARVGLSERRHGDDAA